MMNRFTCKLLVGLIPILAGLNCGQSDQQASSLDADSVHVEQTTPSRPAGESDRDSIRFIDEVSETPIDTMARTVETGYVMIDEYIGSPLNSRIIAVIIDPSRYRPKVVGVSPSMPSGQSIVGGIQRQGADIVVGSGYVETYYPPTPTGLLIANGALINPLNPGSPVLTAVVGVERGELFVHRANVSIPERATGAFQVGPWLVEDGKNIIHPREPETKRPFTRAFIGVRNDGFVVAGVTQRPVHLYHLADYMSAGPGSRGLECVTAVNLAGGGSDGLAVKQGDSVITFRSTRKRQASILCFIRTEQP